MKQNSPQPPMHSFQKSVRTLRAYIKTIIIGLSLILIAGCMSDASAQCWGANSGWGGGLGNIYGTTFNSCTGGSITTAASSQYHQWDGIAGENYTFTVSGNWASANTVWSYSEVVGGVWTVIQNGTGQTANITAQRSSPAGNGWNLIVFYNNSSCPPSWPGTSTTLTYKMNSSGVPTVTAPTAISTNNSPNNGCGAAEIFPASTGSSSCSASLTAGFNLASSSGPLSSVAGNLKLWCRGDAGVVQDVSSNVYSWSDISGNSNIFNQGTQGNRPSYTAASTSFNGKPTLTFNTSQYMVLANNLDGNALSNYTMFVVDRLSGTNSRLISSATTNWLFGDWGGGEEKLYCNNWISSSAATPSGDALPHMYEVTSSSNSGNGTSLYDYGILQATGTAGSPNGPGQIQLNGWSNGLSEISSGEVAEVIYYNTVLSAAQRQIIEGYLAYKYNLPCPLASAKAYQTFTGTTTYGFNTGDLIGRTAATTQTASITSYPGPTPITITNPTNCQGNSTTTLSVANGMSPAGSCLTTGTNTSNYLLVGTSGTTSNVTIGSAWTIGTWIKFPLPANPSWNTIFRGIGYHPIIVERTQGATNAGLILGAFQGGFYPASAASSFNGSTIAGVAANVQSVDISTLSAGWHHIAATGSGNTESFYIDGVFVGKSAIQVGFSATDNLIAVGNYQGGGQDAGTMDEVKIYNTALSQNAISNFMTQPSTSATDPNWNNLVAYYKMDASPVVNSATGTAACTSCSGTVQGSATAGATATAYYTYNWSGPGSPTFSPAASTTSETVTLNSEVPANSGTYSVYATANSCNSQTATSATVTIRPTPTASISGSTNTCQGSTAPNITFTNGTSLPVTVSYTLNTVAQAPVNIAASSTATVSQPTTTTGTYTYALTSVVYQTAPTCSNTISGSAVINVVTTPTGGTIATVNYCASAGSAAVNITGVTGATQYAWSLPSGLTGASTTSGITVSGSTAGSYTVTATPQTVGSGITCSGTPVTGTVNIVTTPTGGSIATVNYCASAGSAAVNITGVAGATQYAWSLPGVLTGTSTTSSITVSGSTAGTYTVTATPQTVGSGITCSGTPVTGTVNVVTTPTGGTIATVNYCASAGSAAVNITGVTGATQYAWSLPGSLTGTSTTSSITVSGATPGSYTVTATPQTVGSGITCSGTPVTGTVNIVTTPTGGAIATVNYCASAGSAAVNITGVTGATQYAWALPSGLTGTSTTSSITVSGSAAGSYTVTATPRTVGSGITCSGTPVTGTVNVVTTPTGGTIATVGFCASVGSGSVSVSGVTGATQYAWSLPGSLTGTSTTSSITVSGTTPGSYTVTATPQTVGSGITCNGTPVTGTVNITNAPTSATLSDVIDGCNGGHTATVTITGGTSPYNFTLCGTAYINKTSPFVIDATSNTSCTLTAVTDATGCAPASVTGTPLTYPARVLTTGDTYACTIATGATKIFYDNSGNLMTKIRDGGNTLGSTTVVATVDAAVQKFGPTNQQSYLQRHFKITPANTSGSADVCLYFSDAEVAALNDTSVGDNHSAPSYYPTFQTNLSNVVVTKFHGAGETPVSNVSRQVIVPTNANKTHNPVVNGVTYNNVWEMCFSVTSWSGFYIHGQNTNNTPLPVSLLYLTADAIDNKYIQLDWATATEVNNKEFDIERSTDGSDFTQIGTTDGHGNSNSTITYSFDDKSVQPGVVYYYRLKQVDIDGKSVYTEIVSSSLIGDKGFVFEDLIPNPAINTVQLGILSTTGQKTTITITDMLGRVVMNTPWQLSEGYNISTFDVSGLAGGTYNVTVYAGTTYTTKRLVVTK